VKGSIEIKTIFPDPTKKHRSKKKQALKRTRWGTPFLAALKKAREYFYGFSRDERRISDRRPTKTRINGHHCLRNGCGNKPKFARRKTMPKAIRMNAPIPDLDFIIPPS